MVARFTQLEELPQRKATQVKNKWGDLVRQVRAQGSVAVTNHNRVEMVVMEAGRYREMAALLAAAEDRRRSTLAELAAEFDQHLAGLKDSGARERIEAAMEARGQVMPRPKAGTSF